jgi:peptidoglycan hydrolase-like protein with peptidoglycan-binding domain
MRPVLALAGALCALSFAFPTVADAAQPAQPIQGGASPAVAALQVALRHRGLYAAAIDGLEGPMTTSGLQSLRAKHRVGNEQCIGPATRKALGVFGKPLLGQRELGEGAVGWDVSSLEFRLLRFGLPRASVDGRMTKKTVAALRRFQRAHGLAPDGIAGRATFRALAGRSSAATVKPVVHAVHVVDAGESFFSIAQAYRVSPMQLAQINELTLSAVIVPGQRLRLPVGAAIAAGTTQSPVSRDEVKRALDRWSTAYGVDPKLSRAVAWMESGFQQHVVSGVGAVGVMQLLPETWAWLDEVIGVQTPRTYEGNVRAGVRYLRWLLDSFNGNTRLALAGYYQGAAAVRNRGLFDDTKRYVAGILRLYGSV